MVVLILRTSWLPITATATAPVPFPPTKVIVAVVKYPKPGLITSTAITRPALLILAVITAVSSAVPVTTTSGGTVYPVPPSTIETDSMLSR